jgi:hypothetical protein
MRSHCRAEPPVGQDDAGNRPFVVDPEELVDRVRAARLTPPPLQVSRLPNPCLDVREASALQKLRRQSEILEALRAHFIDRHASSAAPSNGPLALVVLRCTLDRR